MGSNEPAYLAQIILIFLIYSSFILCLYENQKRKGVPVCSLWELFSLAEGVCAVGSRAETDEGYPAAD